MSDIRNYVWDPPDAGSVLKFNGVKYRKGDTFAADEATVLTIAAAWSVPVKRADLTEAMVEALDNSGIRSSTVDVPVPVVLDLETGEHVGGELDLDGALDEAPPPGEANPKMSDPSEAAKVRRTRRRR